MPYRPPLPRSSPPTPGECDLLRVSLSGAGLGIDPDLVLLNTEQRQYPRKGAEIPRRRSWTSQNKDIPPKPRGVSQVSDRDALEGKGPQGRPQRRLDGRLEEAAEAVGGGYCRLQMPLSPALGVRGTVAGHGLGALEGGQGTPPSFPLHP